jgi:hypothetical protein
MHIIVSDWGNYAARKNERFKFLSSLFVWQVHRQSVMFWLMIGNRVGERAAAAAFLYEARNLAFQFTTTTTHLRKPQLNNSSASHHGRPIVGASTRICGRPNCSFSPLFVFHQMLTLQRTSKGNTWLSFWQQSCLEQLA